MTVMQSCLHLLRKNYGRITHKEAKDSYRIVCIQALDQILGNMTDPLDRSTVTIDEANQFSYYIHSV